MYGIMVFIYKIIRLILQPLTFHYIYIYIYIYIYEYTDPTLGSIFYEIEKR